MSLAESSESSSVACIRVWRQDKAHCYAHSSCIPWCCIKIQLELISWRSPCSVQFLQCVKKKTSVGLYDHGNFSSKEFRTLTNVANVQIMTFLDSKFFLCTKILRPFHFPCFCRKTYFLQNNHCLNSMPEPWPGFLRARWSIKTPLPSHTMSHWAAGTVARATPHLLWPLYETNGKRHAL